MHNFIRVIETSNVSETSNSPNSTSTRRSSLPSINTSSSNNEYLLDSLSFHSSLFKYPSIDRPQKSVHNIWGHAPTNYDKTDDNWGEKYLKLIFHPVIFINKKERKNKINLNTENLKVRAQMKKSKSVSSIHIDFLYVKTSFGQFLFCA